MVREKLSLDRGLGPLMNGENHNPSVQIDNSYISALLFNDQLQGCLNN